MLRKSRNRPVLLDRRSPTDSAWAGRSERPRSSRSAPWRRPRRRTPAGRWPGLESDKATGLLRSKDPILVTRRGRLAGVFFPRPDATLPLELKSELFSILSAEVARQLRRRRITEKEVLEDFAAWRKSRRETRRRR
jgi:hypothetical protein